MQARSVCHATLHKPQKTKLILSFLSHVRIVVSIVCIGCLCASTFVCHATLHKHQKTKLMLSFFVSCENCGFNCAHWMFVCKHFLYVMLLYTNLKKQNSYYLFLSHVRIVVSIVCIEFLCASTFVCHATLHKHQKPKLILSFFVSCENCGFNCAHWMFVCMHVCMSC